MKIGMIGAGAVGAPALMAILNRHAADEIIVLD
jgi:malate/lactate dehydrogenase